MLTTAMGYVGGSKLHPISARLPRVPLRLGTVLAVKGALRCLHNGRALDGPGPFRKHGRDKEEEALAEGPRRRQNGPFSAAQRHARMAVDIRIRARDLVATSRERRSHVVTVATATRCLTAGDRAST